ncbi:polyamine ABC transporter substrate-binding protein [Roseibium algicola]|jgi:putrescine transport system substrate-binding protein|uniref:Putrescine-binding periplasmic protein n=1 Tax=Roseibium algicola TaxID=2857014 RepID=A0ABM6HZ95_9HYPH|nr:MULTISPECIES: polyamine ABC transporter substrate-binding protein [Stappiaceae]MCR9281670.1 polyamine ABC transporter substrate-binding protein [Paracoccaceae bacterium]MEC9403915.1 polyamine ABC transporter substrate-binding protein [Pseudomonadota bacterium]AMN54912.1 spermidine/putrescine ABC transporter substrate-binding protein [Labrenzia sp. CP4]AQQ03412.1 polyamine ABC transporter substrate-binding protein [Roseibium aggregatum]MBO9461236.1 polyamine ABC transporter substrate-binding
MTFKSMLTGVAVLSLMSGAAFAQDKVVNVYNWSDYIDETILEDFTKETGIKVVYDVFDSNEVLETKLLAGGTGYDVVVPTGTFLARQIQAGVFSELDKSKLTNLSNMWKDIEARVDKYDPGNKHSINYMWGTTGFGYNVDKVKAALGDNPPVDSWDLLFKKENIEKLKDCGVFILDAPTELIPAALNYLGLDPDSKDPAEIEKAGELLMSVRPYIQKFHSSEYINALANGDICLAVGWSGDVLQARDRAAEADNGVTVEYSIPKEGALMWFDQMAIPADAPHKEEAHEFLNYIMRPEVMAKASNVVYYANGNKASQEFLNEDVIGDPAIYPTEEAVKNLYTVTPYPPKVNRVVTRTWTSVKSGQ